MELPELLGPDIVADALTRLVAAVGRCRIVVGWATVELDRAEVEVAAVYSALNLVSSESVPDDRLLGAGSRLLRFSPPAEVLLLEPSTEGRLAAALARHGEGPLVVYLIVEAGAPERARRAGFTLSSQVRGPLGPERLVVVGPKDGPFAILAGLDERLERRARPIRLGRPR